MLNNVSWLRVSARPLITDVTTHRAPSLDGFQHFRFYCSNFAVKYLLIIADILVITYTGELMFNIMIYNITKIRIRLSICTSSEVVLSSICSLNKLQFRPNYQSHRKQTLSSKCADSPNHSQLYISSSGPCDVLKEYFGNFPMRNDGTCPRRNPFSSPRHRWPFKLKSHYNQTIHAVCV